MRKACQPASVSENRLLSKSHSIVKIDLLQEPLYFKAAVLYQEGMNKILAILALGLLSGCASSDPAEEEGAEYEIMSFAEEELDFASGLSPAISSGESFPLPQEVIAPEQGDIR